MHITKQVISRTLIISLLVAATVSVMVATAARAQEDTAERQGSSANALRVAPLRTDVTADPGERKTVKVTITNPSSNAISVRPVQNDFVAGDEEGTPAIILGEDEYAPKRSLKRFMRPLEPLSVPAGQSRTVDVVIDVPANANPGGYFGALRFAPVSTVDGGQVNLSASVASLILLRVNGDAQEVLELTDFSIRQSGKEGSFFTDAENIAALVRFKNDGDAQLGPFGKLSVLKGSDVVYEADFNTSDQRDVVLPDSARRWVIPVKDLDGFGQYKATATFTYGTKNQTVEVSKTFWVVPVWMIVVGVVSLLLLAGGIYALIRYRRNHASRGLPKRIGRR